MTIDTKYNIGEILGAVEKDEEGNVIIIDDRICDGIKNLWFVPSPFAEMLMDDIKYNNFGIQITIFQC